MAGRRDLAAPPAAPLILASTSPRRREILGQLGIPFDVVAPSYEEASGDPVAHAVGKARSVIEAANGRPVLGSWLTYALGSEAENLPAYCVLSDPTGLPVLGVDNWSCGWLPSLYQGTVVRSQEPRILNLDPPPSVTPKAQERFLNYLQQLNEGHLSQRPGETDLSARYLEAKSFSPQVQRRVQGKAFRSGEGRRRCPARRGARYAAAAASCSSLAISQT